MPFWAAISRRLLGRYPAAAVVAVGQQHQHAVLGFARSKVLIVTPMASPIMVCGPASRGRVPPSRVRTRLVVLGEGRLQEGLVAEHHQADPVALAAGDEVVQHQLDGVEPLDAVAFGVDHVLRIHRPERSTASIRSRADSIFSIGGSTYCGRARAVTISTQASGAISHWSDAAAQLHAAAGRVGSRGGRRSSRRTARGWTPAARDRRGRATRPEVARVAARRPRVSQTRTRCPRIQSRTTPTRACCSSGSSARDS